MIFLIALGGLVALWLLLEWRQHRKGRGRLTVRRDRLPNRPYVGEPDNPQGQMGNFGGPGG